MDTIGLQNIQNLARQESAKLHHYFIGVEHLFIAMTQVTGGLTNAVLEHHGLSPRFVRYSIRESVGRYEDRRFWAGFPETPRVVEVLSQAKHYAGIHTSSERDLLLAVLDEGDSIAVRVLVEMGADIADLRRTAANWSSPLRPQPPEIPIDSQVKLNAEQRRVLQLMFRDYGQVSVVRELEGGYSGARVLLVRPIRVDGYKDAPVVVKLDDRYAILYERRRYDLHVKSTLPSSTARLVDAPTVPDNSSIGGLKYTFVGRLEDMEPVSLREFARQHDPKELSGVIRSLFDIFGQAWWLQRKPYRFGAWREYEHTLPPALVIDALPDEDDVVGEALPLTPLGAWSRTDQIMPGQIVSLRGFAVQKIDIEGDILHVASGAQAEAINRSGKVQIRGLQLTRSAHFRGEIIDELVGRVVRTRQDLLLRVVHNLEPPFDVHANEIAAQHDLIDDLPNPLMHIQALLERQVSGYLSTIHGDLHLGNVLVGPHGDAWLIDFEWTRDGHSLFDWAMLEASILVEVVSRAAPPGWEGAWGIVGLLASINRGEERVLHERHYAARALTTVRTIRDIVAQCMGSTERWHEYYLALAFMGLRLAQWQSESLDARRLAFLVSALALRELQSTSSTSRDGAWSDATTDLDQTEIQLDD